MITPVLPLCVSASPLVSQQIHGCVRRYSYTARTTLLTSRYPYPYLNFKNPSGYLSARVLFSAIRKLVLPLSPTVHLVLRLSNFGNQRMGDAKVVRLTEVASRFHFHPFSWLPRLCAAVCCPAAFLSSMQYLMPSRQGQVRLVRSPFFWEKSRIHRSKDVCSGERKTKDTESRVGSSLG